MSTGGHRFAGWVSAPDWGPGHLTLEAVVAYADHELAPAPQDRATRHLGVCRECAAQVGAQIQARTALRSAGGPTLPMSLMASLRSIPQVAELPPPPHGLAVTADGQLVSMLRLPSRSPSPSEQPDLPPAGLSARPARADHDRRAAAHRRARMATGVAATGLALLALGAAALPSDSPVPDTGTDPGVFGGAPIVDAHLRLPVTGVDPVPPDNP